jgi:hypothetical protein
MELKGGDTHMTSISNRIVVHLLPEEGAAFAAMIEQDTRSPRDQVRHLVVQEAYRRGLLDPPTHKACTNEGKNGSGGKLPTARPAATRQA